MTLRAIFKKKPVSTRAFLCNVVFNLNSGVKKRPEERSMMCCKLGLYLSTIIPHRTR